MKLCRVAGAIGLLVLFASSAWAGPVYFLVTELPGHESHHDSYVVPINSADDIAHARDLITRGPDAGAIIVNASIAAGSDGVNRDHLKPDKPQWHWHVNHFDGFADFSIEILDGWPGEVERDVPGWINNTNGRIAFWNYTVTRELGTTPVAVPLPSPLHVGAMLLLAVAGVASLQRFRRRAC